MSKRENIAGNIITVLDAVSSPIEFKKLTKKVKERVITDGTKITSKTFFIGPF